MGVEMDKDQCFYLIAISLQALFKDHKSSKEEVESRINHLIDGLEKAYKGS